MRNCRRVCERLKIFIINVAGGGEIVKNLTIAISP